MVLLVLFCLGLIAVSTGLLYLILRKNRSLIPRGAIQWAATALCVFLVGLSGLTLIFAWSYEEADPDVSTAVYVEPFEFQLVSTQETQNIDEFSGRVVLLNFWATWCQPCITELPELDALQSAYSDQGLVVVTLSDEELEELNLYSDLLPQETVSGYIKQEELPESFRNELANGRPVTYVIDAEGLIRERIRGAGNFEYFEGLVTPWLAALES